MFTILDMLPKLYQLYMIKVTNDTGGVNDRDHSKRIWQMDQNEAEIASLAS